MFDNVKADFYRSTNKSFSFLRYFLLCISSKGVAAVKDYRIANWLYVHKLVVAAKLVQNRNLKKHGCDIGCNASIGKGLALGHPVGIVIAGKSKIGCNCTIMSCVTIGAKSLDNAGGGYPCIGDNVYIGTGAKLIGNVSIGKGVVIGANAVVLNDVNDNSIAVGVPARILVRK